MLLWSKGLGKRVVWLNLGKIEPSTVDEVTEDLPQTVQENIEEKVSENSIALTGGKIEPVKWDFVILLDKEDVLELVDQLLMDELYDLGVEIVYTLLLNLVESQAERKFQEKIEEKVTKEE